MLNFSTVLLGCGTTIYIMQDDFQTGAIMITLGIIGRIMSFVIEIGERGGNRNEKKQQEILQEQVH